MAVECNALTAVMEPSPPLIDYLIRRRELNRSDIEERLVYPDSAALPFEAMHVDLDQIETLVALPGHPGNGVPLNAVRGTRVDLAYAGSCTAGDLSSIAMYASVLKGRKVRIPTFIQYGSERVREEARKSGLHGCRPDTA